MAEIERDNDDILIRLTISELEELTNALEAAGNSACRLRTNYAEGSLPYTFQLDKAETAWYWAENLSIHKGPKNGFHHFKAKF